MNMRYYLTNSYQDEGPQRLAGEDFDQLDLAIARAEELGKDRICYGEVRVVDTRTHNLSDWQQEAELLGVPIIPPIKAPPPKPKDYNPIVAICGQCGLHVHARMMYACTNANCPVGLCGPQRSLTTLP